MRKIQKTICREELKSRIPALFAYIEENDAGEFKLHTATDSLQGCYGKIVENITLPKGFALSIKEGEDTKSLLKDEETYSYRTLMNYYYEYKDYDFTDEDNSTFIDFIVRAIGKVKIDTENKYKDCDINIENNGLYVMGDSKCYCKITGGKMAEKYPWEERGEK